MIQSFKTFYRRRLPHWQPEGATIFFTWRLYGSMPKEALERLAEERKRLERKPHRAGESERQRAIRHDKIIFGLADEILDRAKHGPLWLKDPRLAKLVADAFFYHNGQRYDLFAYVVMPNHVHVLLRPKEIGQPEENKVEQPFQAATSPRYVPICKITQGLKGYTAREANRLLGRTGQPFWQDESYDHWVRDETEFIRIIAYIENNPVKAGLVARPEDWRWSSAWERRWGRLVGQTF